MSLIQDLRYSLRRLAKSSGFTATAVLTLALGMGATTAMYSVIHAVLLNSLPIPDSDRLYIVRESTSGGPMSVAWPNFEDWRSQAHSFEPLAAYTGKSFQFFDGAQTALFGGLEVSANFFSVTRAQPFLGRFFTEAEDKPGAPAVAVLGYRFWQSELRGDPKVIGSAINLNEKLYTIVGVTSPEFHFWLSKPEGVYVPIGPETAYPGFNNRTAHGSMQVLARPLPGVSEATARTQLENIAARLAAQYPATNGGHSIRMYRADRWYLNDVAPVLWLLMAAVAIVLLVGCANVSNLLLTRGADREREYAIRSALGASSYRVFQQSMVESLWLAFIAGGCGVLIAYFSLPILVRLGPTSIPRLDETAIEWPVLGFSFAVTFVVALACSVLPAWATLHIAPEQALRSYSSSSYTGRGRQFVRSSLLVAGVAVTVILAAGTGLMLQSLRKTLTVDPGFQPDHLLTLNVILTAQKYHSPEASLELFTSAEDKLRSLPGVKAVGAVCASPLQGECGDYWYSIPGRTDPNDANMPEALINTADEGYFRAAGIRLISGRTFSTTDGASSPHVAVINHELAEKWWPSGDAVGHLLRLGGRGEKGDVLQIVGVVDGVKQFGLDTKVEPEIFSPLRQRQSNNMALLARTANDPESLAASAESAIQSIDKQVSVRIHSMNYYVAQSLRERRFLTLLLSIFAALAIFLAAMGVFGVAAYAVASRKAEIAVRLALGAQPQTVKRWIIVQTVSRVVLGSAIGVIGAFLLARLALHLISRVAGDLLYGVSATDPLVLSATCAVLIGVAILATWIPAGRAAAIDPLQTLRAE